MKPTLLFIIFTLMLLGCNSSDHQSLTFEKIEGNWYFIDTICDPDPNAENKNYVELTFTDSLLIYYAFYPGLGPMYWPYELTSDSLIINGENTVFIKLIDDNKISLGVYCNPSLTYELQRMPISENTLKECKMECELDDFIQANYERRNQVITDLL